MKRIIIDIEGGLSIPAAFRIVEATLDAGRISEARGVAKCSHMTMNREATLYTRDRRTKDGPDSFIVRPATRQ